MKVKKGDTIKIEYTGKLDDGTVFDDSLKHGQPLEFKVGDKQVIPGFDKGVEGLELDEEKDIHIESKDAYGEHKPEMMKKVPREQLPKEPQPKEGMLLMVKLPNGAQFPAKIVKVEDKVVTLDLNHPLAGQNLNFHVKVVEINGSSGKKSNSQLIFLIFCCF